MALMIWKIAIMIVKLLAEYWTMNKYRKYLSFIVKNTRFLPLVSCLTSADNS